MKKDNKDFDPSGAIGGTLNILGLKIDLAKLLSSPEDVKASLDELRERLKAAGGKEVLSDAEWRQGNTTITGHIRTRGPMGEREFHIGTLGKSGRKTTGQPAADAREVVEPPVDVFYEGDQIVIVADVPGITLEDLVLKVVGEVFSLSAKTTARRNYRKELRLEADVDAASLQSTCHNGVLEVRLRRQVQAKVKVSPKK